MRFTAACFIPGIVVGVFVPMCLIYVFVDHDVSKASDVLIHRLDRRVTSPLAAPVHVCMTSDENTIIGAVATINSIHTNTRHPVKFHLVTNKASENHLRQWIKESSLNQIDYEIKVFDELTLAHKIKVRGGRTELAKPMNYARFYYEELFPELRGIIIHIDDDIIVQGDIFELAHAKISNDSIIAVSDECTSSSKRFHSFKPLYSSYINFQHPAVETLDMKPGTCSFNTGLYVMDLDKWRKNNITEQLEYWMELNTRDNIYGNGRGGGGSQPPMMIALYKKFSLLRDPMWHVRNLGLTPASRFSKHFIQHAKLLHWNGQYKPWGGVSQFSQVWDQYFVPDPNGKYIPVRKFQ